MARVGAVRSPGTGRRGRAEGHRPQAQARPPRGAGSVQGRPAPERMAVRVGRRGPAVRPSVAPRRSAAAPSPGGGSLRPPAEPVEERGPARCPAPAPTVPNRARRSSRPVVSRPGDRPAAWPGGERGPRVQRCRPSAVRRAGWEAASAPGVPVPQQAAVPEGRVAPRRRDRPPRRATRVPIPSARGKGWPPVLPRAVVRTGPPVRPALSRAP